MRGIRPDTVPTKAFADAAAIFATDLYICHDGGEDWINILVSLLGQNQKDDGKFDFPRRNRGSEAKKQCKL